MGIIITLIILAALGAIGFLLYNKLFLETKNVERAFDTFVIKESFKWLSSADQQFNQTRHFLASSTMDLSGYSIDIRQMIVRDYSKYKIFLCDISSGTAAGTNRMMNNKTSLYLMKKLSAREKIFVKKHGQGMREEDAAMIKGARLIAGGLNRQFGSLYSVTGVISGNKSKIFTEDVQKLILNSQTDYPFSNSAGGTEIYFNENGFSITSTRTYDEKEFKDLIKLGCEIGNLI
ncbi:MAG: hypothetical protein K8T10_09040 [Candidatus Eremiobacteraeota bacterium]|nr:hypothetical protein [Candidatus Eremiobacteraeota bacterium]